MSKWKDKGYVPISAAPDYLIDSTGDVIGRSGVPMRPSKIGGYFVFTLTTGHHPQYRRKTYYVHRLVAEAFLEKPSHWTPAYQVQPKNRNKLDTLVSNLAWMNGTEAHWHRRGK